MAITQSVGSMQFFIVIPVWTLLWLGWNLFAPPGLLLMPLIMVGQNVLARRAEARSQHDFEILVDLTEARATPPQDKPG